ncbi:hypothetical protein ACGGAI_24005 [Streptomyces antibioticus]|uniref:hypothetical protein n=1 Tax=Streptomyces antibioticus TaxID=1890 RepID=UPI003711AC34
MFLSGEMLTAQRLNRLQPDSYNAVGTSNLALSTSEADITGASVTLTTETPGAYYVVTATFAFDITSATTAFASGICQLDGASLIGNARWSGEVTTDFGEASFQWRGAVGAAGSHTFKLRGSMSSGTGIQVLAAFTTLAVTIYEDV